MKSIDIDEFNIKTYLSCIEKCKIAIDEKLKQLNEIKRYSNLIGCTNLSNTYTYTGNVSDKTGNAAEKKLDLVIEIKRDSSVKRVPSGVKTARIRFFARNLSSALVSASEGS